MVQLSHLHLTTGKPQLCLDGPLSAKWYLYFLICRFKISRFVKAFLPWHKCPLISWLHSQSSDSEAQENKICHCFHFFPIFAMMDAMILAFWMLSFKPTFSLSSFTFIKRLFSSSSLSAITVTAYAYQSLLFLPAILIPPCDSSNPAFGMRYSACRPSQVAQMVSVCLQCGRPRFDPRIGKIPWRRKWQPTSVLLPGKLHGGRSLVGYSPWGCKELDTTEQLHTLHTS